MDPITFLKLFALFLSILGIVALFSMDGDELSPRQVQEKRLKDMKGYIDSYDEEINIKTKPKTHLEEMKEKYKVMPTKRR